MHTVTIDDALIAQAVQKTGISNHRLIVEASIQLLISMTGRQPELLELLEDIEDIRDAEIVLERNEPTISMEDLRKELGLAN